MTANRIGNEDRLTEVDNGRHVGRTTVDIAFVPAVASAGYYEYAVVKYERSTSVPTIGVDPVPSSADINTNGMQQACRSLTPGYVLEFGIIPLTHETIVRKKIIIKWDKFGKALCRDGDYFTILLFNRTQADATVYDIQVRYKTYTVK